MAPMLSMTEDGEAFEDSYDSIKIEENDKADLHAMAFWYMILMIAMLLLWLVTFFCLRIIALSNYRIYNI